MAAAERRIGMNNQMNDCSTFLEPKLPEEPVFIINECVHSQLQDEGRATFRGEPVTYLRSEMAWSLAGW